MAAARRPAVSIVTHGEIRAMADRRGWGAEKLASLTRALDEVVTVDLNDESVLESYVVVRRVSNEQAGGARAMSDNDCWIAATARAAEAVLLTTDKDFAHLDPAVCRVELVGGQ